jgi:hypothetical protein
MLRDSLLCQAKLNFLIQFLDYLAIPVCEIAAVDFMGILTFVIWTL